MRARNTLDKNEKILKKKEELAEGLHLIDFEQLKIENQVTFRLKLDFEWKNRRKKWRSTQTQEENHNNGSDSNSYPRKVSFCLKKQRHSCGHIKQARHRNPKNEVINQRHQRKLLKITFRNSRRQAINLNSQQSIIGSWFQKKGRKHQKAVKGN